MFVFGGKTGLQAEPRQWLQKENNFQTEWLRAPLPRSTALMTHPCKRRSRARTGWDLSAAWHKFVRCIVFMQPIRLAVRRKAAACAGRCRFAALVQ